MKEDIFAASDEKLTQLDAVRFKKATALHKKYISDHGTLAQKQAMATAEAQEEELERLEELKEAYGKVGGAIVHAYEKHIDASNQVLDGFGGAVSAWEEKNNAEYAITRKKLDKEEKDALEVLKNSVEYKRASDKQKKKLEKDLADSQEKTRIKMEDKIAAKEYETAQWRHAIAVTQSIVDTASAVMKALVSIPPNVPLSIAMGVLGAIQTGIILSNPPTKNAQFGMNEIVDSPTLILAGENNQAESVQITPLEGPNLEGPQSQGIVLNISGNVLHESFIEDNVIPQIREGLRLGENMGV